MLRRCEKCGRWFFIAREGEKVCPKCRWEQYLHWRARKLVPALRASSSRRLRNDEE